MAPSRGGRRGKESGDDELVHIFVCFSLSRLKKKNISFEFFFKMNIHSVSSFLFVFVYAHEMHLFWIKKKKDVFVCVEYYTSICVEKRDFSMVCYVLPNWKYEWLNWMNRWSNNYTINQSINQSTSQIFN